MLKRHFTLICLTTMLMSCFGPRNDDDIVDHLSTSIYQPIIINRADFESSTRFENSRPILNSGKIYTYNDFLFINEKHEGFHVFDNSNPQSPTNIGFIKVILSTDMAAVANILYFNNGIDLVAIAPNISANTIEITKRIKNAFPDSNISPDGFIYNDLLESEVIVGWELIE